MALSITDDCINCGLCEPECPVGAISEGDYVYEIDPNKCNECVGYHDQPRCVAIGPIDCFLDANGNPYRLPRP